MPRNNVLSWLDGSGWLVLSGSAAAASEIRAQVLQRATAAGGVAYIAVNTPKDSDALSDMDDLGAPAGYWVDVLTEDDETVRTRLSEASVIVVEDTESPETLRSGLMGAAVEGIKAAFDRGAIILAEGASAAVFGGWLCLDSGETISGLKWVDNAFILPEVTSPVESNEVRTLLNERPDAIAIGIGQGAALALGPGGEVEIWGRQQVTVSLGRGYHSGSE